MFRKKDIDLYCSITAPDSLKERVSKLQQPKAIKPWYQRYGGMVAACAAVALILSSVLFMDFTSPENSLMVQGASIGQSPIELTHMASTAKLTPSTPNDNSFTTVLKCQVSGNTTITVSGGTIYDTKASEAISDSVTVEQDTSLCWTVEPEEDVTSYVMTMSTMNSVNTYVLQQNKENGIWTIFQQ